MEEARRRRNLRASTRALSLLSAQAAEYDSIAVSVGSSANRWYVGNSIKK
jgi:hypothetical protein